MFYDYSWQDISIDQFISEVDAYMHWYAEKRVKVSLGGLSPLEYRRKLGIASCRISIPAVYLNRVRLPACYVHFCL